MNRTRTHKSSFRLYDYIPDGVIVLRPDYTVIFWNSCMAAWTGISPSQAQGMNILEQYPSLKNPLVISRITQLFEGGPAVLFSPLFHPHLFPCLLPDGKLRVQKISCIPMDYKDEICALFVIEDISDLTNQVKAYREMKKVTERQFEELKEAHDAINQAKILLLREVHHRVKNNLQIILSLINLQMRQMEIPQFKEVLADTMNRVRAMSIVHEKLYQSESLSQIDLADYARYLVTQLYSFFRTDTRRVKLDISMGKIMVDINTAIPVGLIINELVSNTLRHAFPAEREGTISITGRSDHATLTLEVKDDGIGMPPDLDWKDPASLGLRLVNSLVKQLHGTIEYRQGAGTMAIITLQLKQSGESRSGDTGMTDTLARYD